ncbi:hypothetical protein J6590_020050, partial [Homalodisca vitripennis]
SLHSAVTASASLVGRTKTYRESQDHFGPVFQQLRASPFRHRVRWPTIKTYHLSAAVAGARS